MKATVRPQDMYCVADCKNHKLTCYDFNKKERWNIPCRGDGVNGPGFNVQGGDTPPGLYEIGVIIETQPHESQKTWNAYGKFFCDLIELENQEISRGRAGCGVHGGGSASPNPLADFQGWYPTLGCLRIQNKDLIDKFVPMCLFVKKNKGKIYVEVNW